MEQAVLRTQGLTKKYGSHTALSDVSLTLAKGDIYGLVGRNGAGKTTFFKCVMGLAKHSGTIEIGGAKTNLNIARRQIGFMINAAFEPYLNPRENLECLCRVKGIREKDEVERLLRLVDLYGVKKPFKSFSMGMKQRLGLAGALLARPPVVILDEPVNGLDPQGIADIRGIIKQENAERGTTFIVSSHILSELDLVATRFGFIEQGKLLKEIAHADLHEHTKKRLVVEVDDTAKAQTLLRERLNVSDAEVADNRIVMSSYFDKPDEIGRLFVTEGLRLYRLAPQETTLEEYFIGLVGGEHD